MLHIVLLILKIIGIIVAVLLGLILLALCMVLFVPIRYQGELIADSPENSGIKLESIKANAKVSWLLHLVSAKIIYENKNLDVQVKIFGKKLNSEQKELEEQVLDEKSLEEEILEEEIPKTEEEKISQIPEIPEKVVEVVEIEETDEKIKEDTLEKSEQEEEKTASKKKPLKKKKEKRKKQPLGQKLKSIYSTIQEKIKGWNEKKNQAVEFIKNEAHQGALKRLKKELFRLLKFLKPKKLNVILHFGFEDPSLTGKLLGAICMFYPFFEKHIDITPDFQNQVLKGNVSIKGYVRCVYVLIVVLNMILDRNVRITIKDVIKILKPEMLKNRRKKK